MSISAPAYLVEDVKKYGNLVLKSSDIKAVLDAYFNCVYDTDADAVNTMNTKAINVAECIVATVKKFGNLALKSSDIKPVNDA